MRLWHRVAGVLLEAFAPALCAGWRARTRLVAPRVPPLRPSRRDVGRDGRGRGLLGAAAFIRGQAAGTDARLQAALEAADDAS